jgi:Calcineurin-like phosphoesterase
MSLDGPAIPRPDAPILFAGDPHRNFSPIIRACLARPAGSLVIVGDLDSPVPVTAAFAPILTVGWRLRWILGNHDCETEDAYDNLVGDHPEGDLGWRVATVHGVRIAGLPGVFKPTVWTPPEEPRFRMPADFLAAQPLSRRWRGGLPLWHRDSIFPDAFAKLSTERFDVLVTHEAPSCHPHGFAAIDDLAAGGGARLIVHGHHHQSYTATLPNGIRVRGLGLAEPWDPITP